MNNFNDKKILFIVRGYPGLGRVIPCYAIFRSLQKKGLNDYLFISYLAGFEYLKNRGVKCKEISPPAGNFIELISPQFEEILYQIKLIKPDLICIDGEPYLPIIFKKIGYKILYFGNQFDFFGKNNHFRFISNHLIDFVDKVIIPTLYWEEFSSNPYPSKMIITPLPIKIPNRYLERFT
ncbi:MAG: hypothetical protein KAX28_01350, partial [Candidatus Marinimicrobia bacterium]|nr:hypothetical protein [Candidatus Neomarinimicrobiota bacterium]